MDRIKKLKIKKQDGTFSDYIPIGADAENIDTTDGESVQLKLNKKPYYYDNVADMKADNKLKVGDMAITLGYYEANDGGGAEYKIVADSEEYYEELENDLLAELIIKDWINVKQFGAKGNGENNDTIAINKALKSHTNIYIPDGHYIITPRNRSTLISDISKGLIVQNNQRIDISKDAILELSSGDTSGTPTMFYIGDVSNISINGGTLVGEKNTHPQTNYDCGVIWINKSHYVDIQNCDIHSGWADCIMIGNETSNSQDNATNIYVRKCTLHDSRRCGISLVGCNYITIEDCYIYNISGGSPQCCIDIENNYETNPVTNVWIKDCIFDNNSEVTVTKYAFHITIDSCIFKKGNNYFLQTDPDSIFNNCIFEKPGALIDVHTHIFNNCTFYSNFLLYGTNIQKCICNNCNFINAQIGTGQSATDAGEHTIELNNCTIETDENYSEQNVFLARAQTIIKLNNCKITSYRRLTSVQGKMFIVKNCEIKMTNNSYAPLFRASKCNIINSYFLGNIERVFIVYNEDSSSFICNNTFEKKPSLGILSVETLDEKMNKVFICNNTCTEKLNIIQSSQAQYIPNCYLNNNYPE